MKRGIVALLSFVGALMFIAAATIAPLLTVQAAGVSGIGAVQEMFETENTADFSPFGGKNNVLVTQAKNTPVTATNANGKDGTHNQTTTIRYNTPIYLADNSVEVPFFAFSVYGQDASKRDFDAMIVTLTDAEDASNQVSVLIGFWNMTNNTSWSTAYAKGTGQSYLGYHYNKDSSKSFDGPTDQGTVLGYRVEKDVASTQSLYYDAATNRVLVDGGLDSYKDRNGTVTNDKGVVLTVVRDLKDAETSGNDGVSFTKSIESAYLEVTTVRGWYAYNNIGSSNIYSKNLRGGSESGHTLSDFGARYLIRSIDGLTFGLTDGVLEDSAPVYFGNSFDSNGTVTIPALQKYTVLGGISDASAYTEGLYIEVKDSEGQPVTPAGLADGKWAQGCTFAGESGTYTIHYYADADKQSLVASVSGKVYRPDYENAEPIADPNAFGGEGSAFGWENFRVGNSALMSGVTVSTDKKSTVVYRKDIDISDNTADDVLLEFVAIPAEVGVYDFTSVTFRLIDKNDPANYLTVNLAEGPYGASALGGMKAGGNNQDLYGLKLIRDEDEYDMTVISQTLSGQSNGSIPYMPICLYYDKAGNALYVSRSFNYNSQSAVKGLVRDFDDTVLTTNAAGDTVTQEAWSGFTGEYVTLEITVDAVAAGKTAKYGILTVDGERLTKRLTTEFSYDGIVGYEYELPTPEYVSGLTGAAADFATAKSGMRVLFGSDECTVEGGKFTPKQAGEYTVQYAVEENGTVYMAEYTITVYAAADAPAVEFDLSGAGVSAGDSVYMGGGIRGEVTASTELHHDGSACTVTAELFKDDSSVQTFADGQYEYTFTETGEYTLVLTAEDKAGRITRKVLPITVTRTSIVFADPDAQQSILDRTDTIAFSAADVVASDVRIENGQTLVTEQSDFVTTSVTIEYAYEDGEFAAWTQDSAMDEPGNYTVRYTVRYTLEDSDDEYTAQCLRTVKVVDNTPPVLGEIVAPEGAIPDPSQESTDDALYFKSLTGGTVTVAEVTATDARGDGPIDLSDAVVAKFTAPDGSVEEIAFADGKFTFTPEAIGIYYVAFTVSDGVLTDTRAFVFDVRAVWLDAAFESETLADGVYGKAYTLPAPAVTGFSGAAIADAAVTVEVIPQGGTAQAVQGYTFTPTQTGSYTVRYTVAYGGESVVREFVLEVKDTTPPVIRFETEVPATATAGDTVVLPAIIVTDDKDTVSEYRVWIEFGGVRTEIFDLAFKAEQEGVYKVIVQSSDAAGNPAEISAEITVVAPSEGGVQDWVIAVCCIAGAAVVAGGVAAAVIVVRKKKKAN